MGNAFTFVTAGGTATSRVPSIPVEPIEGEDMTTETTFRGWPVDATAFLAELAADNSAEFWAAQGHRHAEAVLPPLRALAAELVGEFGEVRLFRPYRNRRFRPDAPPYRTDAGGLCRSPGGTGRVVLLSASGLSVEVGRHTFDGPALRAYRAALGVVAGGEPAGRDAAVGVVAGGEPPGRDAAVGGAAGAGGEVAGEAAGRLAAVLAELAARGFVLDGARPLTGTPRGVSRTHPHIELLRLRGVLVRLSWAAGEWLETPESLVRVREAWRAAEPLVTWLDRHVGSG